jgi:hypothetical protein
MTTDQPTSDTRTPTTFRRLGIQATDAVRVPFDERWDAFEDFLGSPGRPPKRFRYDRSMAALRATMQYEVGCPRWAIVKAWYGKPKFDMELA